MATALGGREPLQQQKWEFRMGKCATEPKISSPCPCTLSGPVPPCHVMPHVGTAIPECGSLKQRMLTSLQDGRLIAQ